MKRQQGGIAVAIGGLIMALVAFAIGMGWLDWTPDQVTLFENLIMASGAVIVPLVVWYGSSKVGLPIGHGAVTPVSDPMDNEGRRLVPEGSAPPDA